MEKIFRMKRKPKKPIRRKFREEKKVGDFETAQDIMNFLESFSMDLRKVTIDYIDSGVDTGNYYSYEEAAFIWEELEDGEGFNNRMEKYKEKVKLYNEWKKENEKEIEAYKELKKLEKKII